MRDTLPRAGSAYLIFEGLTIGNGQCGSLAIGSSTGKIGGAPSHDNIFRRIGVFGWKNLSGDNVTVGVVTADQLWPWPNETRIRQDFCNQAACRIMDEAVRMLRSGVASENPLPAI